MAYDYCRSRRNQTAVLWRYAGEDGQGQPIVYDPIQEDVRWEETREDVLNPFSGQMVSKTANVVVGQEIALGSIMRLGELADLPFSGDYRQVIEYRRTENWNGTLIRHVVGLMRYGDSLPESKVGTGTGP